MRPVSWSACTELSLDEVKARFNRAVLLLSYIKSNRGIVSQIWPEKSAGEAIRIKG